MTKLRVYEYAKHLNMSSKEIITILNRLNVPVANHMSVMDDEMVDKVEQFFKDVKARAAERHATEVERELREKQRARERAARQAAREAAEAARRNEEQNVREVQTMARPRPQPLNRPTAKPPEETKPIVATDVTTTPSPKPVTEGTSRAGQNAPAGQRPQAAGTGTEPTSVQPAATQPATAQPSQRPLPRNAPAGQSPAQGAVRRAPQGEGRSPAATDSRNPGQSSPRPAAAGTGRDGSRPQRRPQQGEGQQGRMPQGQGQPGRYRQDGQSSGQRPSSGRSDYQGRRDNQGAGRTDNRAPAGRSQGTGQGGRPQGDGRFRSDSGRPASQGGARPMRPAAGAGSRGGTATGSRGGTAPGGRGGAATGSRGGAAPAAAVGQQKTAGRKDRGAHRQQYERKEQFNEDKLVQRGGRRRGRHSNQNTGATPIRRPDPPKKIEVEGPLTVGEFAKRLRREASEIIKKLLFLGIMATINQEIDTDAMDLIASEYGVHLEVVEPVDEEAEELLLSEDKEEDLVTRPPVVTIMGHVDHGKTTLLDAIRDSRVVASESGGITQHIGAYQIEVNGRKITFLDTPGHEAFTTMRARGAQVTDITILVVAADDGVMPQTVEAINHAKAAKVPIIVAINKMDKPGAQPDRVKQELTKYELVSEEWGGDTIFVEISALKHEGLEELLEMVLLVADVQELKANPGARPRGSVIEAELDKGRGPVATVLVQNGTLKIGDIVVAGTNFGRVRAMVNDEGKRLKEAAPSTPVEIQGLNGVPSAGDLFVVYDDERSARNTVARRTTRERAEQLDSTSRVTLDDLYQRIKEGNMKDLNIIVKADVQGSVEALVQAIEKMDVEGVRVSVIHKGAGAITESDVSLASASNAIIVGFHVRPDVNAKRAAEAEKVDIRLYRVIYNVIDELESAMKGMLDPEFKEVVLGHVEVRQVFHISKVGAVAGCFVKEGKVTRDAEARLIRDGIVVYEGALDTLKRFKDDVREVAEGFECGLTLERFNDIKVGDIVEVFKMEAVKAV